MYSRSAQASKAISFNTASAAGQSEHPSEVNNSNTAKGSAVWVDSLFTDSVSVFEDFSVSLFDKSWEQEINAIDNNPNNKYFIHASLKTAQIESH